MAKKPDAPKTKMQEIKETVTGFAVLIVLGALGWGWITSEDEAPQPPPETAATIAVTDILQQAQERAEEQAATAAQAAADLAEAESLAATQMAEEEAERIRAAEKAEEDAHAKRYGFNCLSGWDGSHKGVVDAVKQQLNDPRSFEHDETRTWPVDENGLNRILMTYRAKNGFGAVVLGKATGSFDNKTCDVMVDSIQ